MTTKDQIPQPPTTPLLGNIPDLIGDKPIQKMSKIAEQYGPIFKLALPGRDLLIITSRELVADACDEKRFTKKVHAPLEEIRNLAGDGLFTAYSDEPNWGKAHRILMPSFGPAAMRGYFDDMYDIADQMMTKWERLGPDVDIDVADNMTRLTLDTIALSGFGYRFNSFYQREMHPFVDAMVRSLVEAGNRDTRLPIQNKLMFLRNRQYTADIDYLHQICEQLINARRKLTPEETPNDLLNLMLNAADPKTGERLDDQNIRYQMVTFLIAGHETTSGLLSFATHLLLDNPDILAKAQAVVDEVLGADQPRFEDLPKLGYLDQILRETLRLYPTAPAFGVYPKEDTVLANRYPLHKGQSLLILIPSLHRDPDVWDDPERFDPGRFSREARENLPEKAWLPFGNGERSCIGRAFALQEATLVLAMMLQRFTISRPTPYTLDVKETLTLKPDGLLIRARVRQQVRRTAQPAEPVTQSLVAAGASHGTPLLVLYGSDSGASESFARRVAGDGALRGYTAQVAPLDDYVGKLGDSALIVVSASYNGKPPENARVFVEWLESGPSLPDMPYAVLGCGSRDWLSTYQAIPTLIDTKLATAGARRLLPRGEVDASGDFYGDFDRWYEPFWETVDAALDVTPEAAPIGPAYDIDVVPSPAVDLIEQNNMTLATVVENRELVDMSSPLGRSKRHLEFALPDGLKYATGDYLAVLPQNHPALIERAARRFGLTTGMSVVLRSNRGHMGASLPTGAPILVGDLLGHHVELSAPATRKDLTVLGGEAAALADRYEEEIYNRRVSVLDLLELYPSIDITFGEFLDLLPAMRTRRYSISSSPLQNPTRAGLTVAIVNAPALSGIGQFHGIASNYLSGLTVGAQVPVDVRSPNVPFNPPADNATPVIMIAAGSGLAPFRGFLQERAARETAGDKAGPALLFFGCDHPDVDYLYRDELSAWEQDGIVTVLPAFSEYENDHTFVQDRVWAERDRIAGLFRQGAVVYVCGDGKNMAPAVRETLVRIYREATKCTESEAAAFAADVEARGRYVADVFS
ncbi:bifunctional cytochrome P450/NADPH--P450 reductase [Sinosporangium siamense]|uniref:Bifunctional cytochrome P450/NADPH--P450 reductase n=1 Tax=Sinosporangium siamense TaxID=1367973 RepID=A0A919RLZ2_9ACTN|nr:cytochrome P450 [Sinosporangium siamense]GII94874.1 bifunctional cytochrome P450/NADPH--P450 reductase 2 [Sinosporangium siamense]